MEVTTMELNVDLQCRRCYKKVKKVLCGFSEIRDQVYDDSKNTVTIRVVCCCPETIKKKIKRKGGGAIKGIEILKKPTTPADEPSGSDKSPAETNNLATSETTVENPVKADPTPVDETSGSDKTPANGDTKDDGGDKEPIVHRWGDGEVHNSCCPGCSSQRPCFHGGAQPQWPFEYYNGNCGPKTTCEPFLVVQYECPQENYGPCRIM